MGGIKHKFHNYFGVTQGDLPVGDQEERLRAMLNIPTLCKLCGKPIMQYATSTTGHATEQDYQRWEWEANAEMHANCYKDHLEGMANGNNR
jgi:hypothetical protein